MQVERKKEALTRLKTVRGHLDGVIRMLEEDAYCVDLMKQISALQASLERVNRVVLASHLESCFLDAVRAGEGSTAISELVDAIKFNPALTGPAARLTGEFLGEPAADSPKERSTS